jgi:acetoin:2,6-dichlorophenolindophenol oxidoreductase subunit alpha
VPGALVEGFWMNGRNSETPLGRRAALAGRVERLARMIEIRYVENRVQRLFSEGQVRGSTHLCAGQEAVSVGIASETRPDDIVACTYRGHGHALALGIAPEQVIGEICGRSIGCAGGLGGSMHLVEPSVGLMPTAAIVGAGLPIACGAALAAKVRKSDRVSVAIFGDGTANIGAFHEALNFAAIQKLAVVFVCENNLYGEYTRINLTTPIENIADRAASYAIPGEVVDGQNVDAVSRSMARAVARARQGKGPSLLEMKTYRYSGHSRSDPATYRPAGELDVWLKRDPIELFAGVLITEGAIPSGDLDRMKAEANEAVEAAVNRALASRRPETREILAHIAG